MENETVPSVYEFGEFRVDTLRMLLFGREGQVVTLPPKAFDLLRVMVTSRGRVLTKDELLSAVWRGSFVEEGNLTQAVSVLRKALNESRNDHRYIVTVPGSGYRFVAEVRELVDDDLSARKAHVASPIQIEKNKTAGRRFRLVVLLSALTLAAVCCYAAYSLWSKPQPTLPVSVVEVKSLAVLPFEYLGAQAGEDHLGIGITDALITNLSNNKKIAVRPTNAVLKYANVKPALVTVGRDLKVDAVLDGRMQRSGDRLRVTVQLVRSSDGVSLWADTFEDDFTNMLTVQDSISLKVAQALALKLSGNDQSLASKRPTENPAAYEAYLRARFFWNKRTGEGMEKSISYFEEAVRLDQQFALAYAGLAESYVLLNLYGSEYRRDAFPKAREAALKALSLNNTIAPAHTALAMVQLEYEYDWRAAEESYRKALELNPNYSTGHHWYSEYLAFLGRFDESVKEIERAYDLDPESLVINTARGYPYMRAGRCDTAIEYFQKALEMERTFPLAHFYLGKCYVEKGQFQDAIREHTAAIDDTGDSAIFMAALGYAYAASGKTTEARGVLKRMKDSSKHKYVSPYSFATVYAGLGETDEAFRWLDQAYEDRDYQLPTLKDDIHFSRLRKDPRFVELLKRIGL